MLTRLKTLLLLALCQTAGDERSAAIELSRANVFRGQEEVVTANQCADENEDKDTDETRPAKRAQPCECIRPSVVPRGLGFGWPGLTDERV